MIYLYQIASGAASDLIPGANSDLILVGQLFNCIDFNGIILYLNHHKDYNQTPYLGNDVSAEQSLIKQILSCVKMHSVLERRKLLQGRKLQFHYSFIAPIRTVV